MTDKLILALDLDRGEEALELAQELSPYLRFFKIGSQLFTREGPALVRALRAENLDVFLDLKWLDISNTVEHAVNAAVELGARFVTLHASNGLATLQAAQKIVAGTATQLLAVTVLTSFDEVTLHQIGVRETVPEQVLRLARLAVEAGIGGLVCSPLEIALIRREIAHPLTLVTPGIRRSADARQDQKRTLSGAEALGLGANHLVVGRPISQARDRVAAAKQFLAELACETVKLGTDTRAE